MQAVVLAHHSSVRLKQLTLSSLTGSLPISKGTILSSILQTFQSAGIFDTIIICRPGEAAQLERCFASQPDFGIDASQLTFIELPAVLSLPECLYRIRDRITCQYLFLTYGDLVVSDLDIRRLFLTMVRTKSSIVSVFAPYTKDQKQIKAATYDLMVMNPNTEQLVMYVPHADMKKQVRFPRQVVASQEHLITCSKYHDVGFYLFSRYSIKLLEWIRDDNGVRKNFLKHMVNVEQYKSCQFDTSSLYSDLPNELKLSESEIPKSLKVSVVVHLDKAICRRLDTPASYLDAVKLFRESYPQARPPEVASKELNPSRTPVAECIVGKECVFGTDVLVRSCILGYRCRIADNSRVVSSVLLSNVVIKEGCKLINCLIGENVTIEENCVLKDCTVAARQRVPPKVQFQNENLGFSEIDPDLM